MTETKTVFRVKLRLASFPEGELTWQRLIVDRPSAEEASELIKWAHRLDSENKVTRPYEQNCSVEKRKVPADGRVVMPLPQLFGALDDSFVLRKPQA
ncbi:MAG: hypothetical protein JWL62_2779 [Hyphomicrobiales bacterium]|jgi:hypothetical protein|nr:hypothetical protein [Hyphomicrobiales bacterium]